MKARIKIYAHTIENAIWNSNSYKAWSNDLGSEYDNINSGLVVKKKIFKNNFIPFVINKITEHFPDYVVIETDGKYLKADKFLNLIIEYPDYSNGYEVRDLLNSENIISEIEFIY